MTIIERVKTFLTKNSNVSLGYNEIILLSASELDQGQLGYSIDQHNNSLISSKRGEWQEEWLVIGTDSLGDPIFVDVSSRKLKVLTAVHGEGDWDPIVIADSLDTFEEILKELRQISVKRSSPVELERNPISDKEQKMFLENIEKSNSDSEIDYRESFFEDE